MTAAPVAAPRPAFWRDVRVLRRLIQVVAVVLVLGALAFLLGTLRSNLQARGISTNFDLLDRPTNFRVGLADFEPSQPIRDVVLLGVKNTFAVVIVGLPLTTLIGLVIGVARLSGNWLVRQAATVYVETLRNIPPLLVIVFVFLAVLLARFPAIQEANTPFDLFVISNRTLSVFSFASRENSGIYLLVMLVGLAVAVGVWVWRTRLFNQRGIPHHRVLWSGGVFLAIGVTGFFVLGRPFVISRPVVDERVVTGGFTMLGSYAAVTLALVLYTASHVAEIVRGSILAVDKGQTEAATAVALSNFQRYRFVILPQAARIAIPPIINQYLSFTKNTSLAFAIGYAEITTIMATVIGNANPAPQSIAILMAVYLSFSLVISVIINIVNRRLQLVT